MDRPSRSVTSTQDSIHEDLAARVRRYRETPFRRPVTDHARKAFETLVNAAGGDDRPLVLDSGCGTGDSSRLLARRHPDSLVIGIDRSAARLGRQRDEPDPGNLILCRAELTDLYRLMADAGWQLSYHYILYPNPWPKPHHLIRRWHASPVFPAMLALGGQIVMRTNWEIYAQEFARALELSGHIPALDTVVPGDEPISPFGRKYAAGGQTLWQVTSLADNIQ